MIKGVFLILSLVLLVAGFAVMGYAASLPDWQALVFFCGIVCVALAFALPIHLLSKFD